MQLESARRRLQTRQARPVTTRPRLSFPTNLVERVGHEKHGTRQLSFKCPTLTGTELLRSEIGYLPLTMY
jgi:hypothetical protein